nr:PREDICTED: protein unc-93 homolog A isoform X2 [Latimeria chalumnae]|eukprot:XP_014344838.1 PREDICTED: protein unc-93 homolog A isoform X2 [Latimeria chalumnae]
MGSTIKNILIISFGFLLLFTAYGGLQSLQSSLNSDAGLGVASLSVIYGSLILSSMFLAPVLIKNLGCKWTMLVSMCCYVTYSLGNFYPSWYTLIPTSVILGLGGAPLWSAKCTYLTISGNQYARKTNKVGQDVINQYFGIFFLIFQSSGVWGNLISSLIFGQSHTKVEITEDSLQYCGAADCPQLNTNSSNITESERPSDTLVYTLLGIYTGCGVLSVLLVAIFLEQADNKEVKEYKENSQSVWSMILATLKHLRDKRQCLLIFLTMYSGFEQGFLAGDYTKSYVTCTLGIEYVGYVMICFSATNSLCSVTFGRLAKYTGRIVLFALAAVINLACIIALLLWKPHPDQFPVFFVFPGLWGMADAVWQTQTNATVANIQ